uniref:Uncharacterized protein TCIL3000_11_13840 n=1 Tax=Trypanosoma congolense (strain IL3000) TaxID=1068625 RepID=G0V2K6_TRYCI|nr:unnamed protein product [Trypanosoma congolense IL3000]
MSKVTNPSGAEGGGNWDPRDPPDTPFIADTTALQGTVISTQFVRRMEEARRLYSLHGEGRQAFCTASQIASWTVATQCCWLGVGAWLVVRGYRYGNPIQSIASVVTSNQTLCRLFTPVALLGWTLTGITMLQIPRDVKLLRTARHGKALEEEKMKDALDQCAAALAEGISAAKTEGALHT